jgi:group I intron endonuclease
MTDLCNRVLNNRKNVCGIYKITNLITGEHYIGQSKNIDDRWKAHCKCGLGIDASATNALYNSMQKDKVWNFTFELLEECPPEQLNEKEAFWIDTYKSNIYGLNTQSGIKKRGTV